MLQIPSPSSLSLAYLIIWAVALIFTSSTITALITLYVNRRKPKDDHAESQARIRRDLAETDEIMMRGEFTLSQRALHYTRKQIRAQEYIFELQRQVDNLTEENERLRRDQVLKITKSSKG